MRLVAFLGLCFFTQSKGYVYFVRSTSSTIRNICYTNETESAVAFIRDLPEQTAYFEKTSISEYRSILNYAQKLNNDCNLFLGCDAWQKNGLAVESNFQNYDDKFPPVLDRRWNYFAENVTSGEFQFQKFIELGENSKGQFHISVLASVAAQIVFSQQDDLISGFEKRIGGFIIVIDGWNYQHKSLVRSCSIIPPDAGVNSRDCNTLHEISNRDLLKSGDEWLLLTFKYDASRSSFGLAVHYNSDRNSFLNAPKYFVRETNKKYQYKNAKWVTGIRSYKNHALFKLHQYNMLRATEEGAEMQTDVEISPYPQLICMEVVYFFGTDSPKKEPIIVEIIEHSSGHVVVKNSLEANADFIWRTERVLTEKLHVGKYSVKITLPGENVFIGDVRFCSNGPEFLTTKDEVKGCQTLKNEKLNDFLVNPPTSEPLCKAFKNDQCQDLQYCTLPNCSCLSKYGIPESYNYECYTSCFNSYYGLNCQFTDGNKADCHSKSHNTGHCPEGCSAGYRKPFCSKKLLFFKTEPIVNPGAYGAKVDLAVSINKLKETFQEGTDFFGVADVQLREALRGSWSEWQSFKAINNLENQSAFDLHNLKPGTKYQIRTVIKEKDNQEYLDELLHSDFETVPCTPRDESNTRLKLNTEFKLEIFSLTNDLNLCQVNKVGLKNHTFQIITYVNDGRSLKEFDEPDQPTLFEVTLFSDGGHTFALNFTFAPLELDSGSEDESNLLLVIIICLVVVSVIAIAVLLVILRKRRATHKSIQNLLSENFETSNTVELDLVPAPERSNSRKSTRESVNHKNKNSQIVRVAELESYVENAMKSNLLKTQHELFPRGQTQSWVVGNDPAYKKKNRYANLAAYDATRVVLELLPEDDLSHYINANYIDGYKRQKAYIATQGPKPQTVEDFWRMIWQEKVNLIVMVANVVENGKSKCEKYWPDVQNNVKFYNFSIHNSEEEVFADFVIRHLWLSSEEGGKRKIVQMHFTTWPDHGVPLYPQSVTAFAKKIIQFQTETPITVHCSAGVGRTGTIILIDACLRMAQAEGFIDVLALLDQMRSQRANMVDNQEQYEFVHLVLLEALVVHQFEVPCKNFPAELNILMAQQKGKLINQFAKINVICEREWARLQTEIEIEEEKCRYPKIIAASAHLVKLYPYGSNPSMSFINAVYVDGFRRKKQFIATQVPMANTVKHFWRMIAQHNVEQVIVLQEPGIEEGGYLPKVDETFVFGDLEVTTDSEYMVKDFQVYNYVITLDGIQRNTVNVVCLSGWPLDQPCGPKVENLIELWEDTERDRSSGVSVVVCYDGVTASGLFLGIGFVLEKIKLEQQVDAAMAMRILRKARPKFIASQDQFEVLFRAAMTYLQAFDTYGNFQ